MLTSSTLHHTRILRWQRADKRNALTPAMLESLLAEARALQKLSRDAHDAAPRAIVLTGEGPTFCAGFDLSLCQHDDRVLANLLTLLSQCISALRAQPLPVVVSAHGAAVAGACALLGAADVVVSTPDAKIGYPVVRLGISPAVSAPTLVEQTSPGIARARLLDTRLVSGIEAQALGLVHELAPDASACEARALALAEQLANKPPHALRATRELCRRLSTELSPYEAIPSTSPSTQDPDASTPLSPTDLALHASLALVHGPEEQAMLPVAWKK
jgi:enoyl-CoA hydratase/carnithine racemase